MINLILQIITHSYFIFVDFPKTHKALFSSSFSQSTRASHRTLSSHVESSLWVIPPIGPHSDQMTFMPSHLPICTKTQFCPLTHSQSHNPSSSDMFQASMRIPQLMNGNVWQKNIYS